METGILEGSWAYASPKEDMEKFRKGIAYKVDGSDRTRIRVKNDFGSYAVYDKEYFHKIEKSQIDNTIKIGDTVVSRSNVGILVENKAYQVVGVLNDRIIIIIDGNETREYLANKFEKVHNNVEVNVMNYVKMKEGQIVKAIEEARELTKDEYYIVVKDSDIDDDIVRVLSENGKERAYFKHRFELTDLDKLPEETSVRRLVETMKELGAGSYESELSGIRRDLDNTQRRIRDYKDEVRRAFVREKELMLSYEVTKKKAEEGNDFTSDIKALLNHEMVTSVNVEDGKLVVKTKNIDIYDEEGNKFRGNKYKLEFNYRSMDCRIYGLDESLCRVSYWASDREDGLDPHPHVNGASGRACWGVAGEMLMVNMNSYEIYASFIVVLNFLQQVNTSDPAGRYIKNWDCINEDNEDIENPYAEEHRCYDCDEVVEEDELRECYHCGEQYCDEHRTFLDRYDRWVCDSCMDNEYSTCEECNDMIRNHESYTCTKCGKILCNGCYTEHCGEYMCDSCYNENVVYCERCESNVFKSESFRCAECGQTICDDCSSGETHEGKRVCDECYEDLIEENEEENEE